MKAVLQGALKRARLERVVRDVYRLTPRSLRRYARALAPDPRLYAPDECRTVIRHSLRWELVPSAYVQWWYYFGFSDPVLDVLRAFAPRCRVIIDVGANVGLYSVVMASNAGADAVVHAFEPHPLTYRQLLRHRDLNAAGGVICHNLACGAEPEIRRLFMAGRGDSAKASLHQIGDAVDAGIDVEVVTLDAMATALGLERLDLIKIDVEGHEPEALIGARRSIERFRPVLCVEVTPHWYGQRSIVMGAAFESLGAAGYGFFSIAPPDEPGAVLKRLDVMAFLASDVQTQANVLALPSERELPAALGRP